MTTGKRTTARDVRRGQEGRRRQAPRPVVALGVDMRLTAEDLRLLSPEQVQAVFEGVGRLVALGVTR